jgi:hypothetical protein
VDREQSLIHLMRVNLFKRMESSINSFALTLEKLLHNINFQFAVSANAVKTINFWLFELIGC